MRSWNYLVDINDDNAFNAWGRYDAKENSMTLKEQIKANIITAMKLKDDVAKNILRVIVGDIETKEVDTKQKKITPLTDEQIYEIIRKAIEDIGETLGYKPNDPTLIREREILTALVPAQLSRQDIINELTPKLEELKTAKSDGQATGIAVKYFKANKKDVNGTLVATVVKELRNAE